MTTNRIAALLFAISLGGGMGFLAPTAFRGRQNNEPPQNVDGSATVEENALPSLAESASAGNTSKNEDAPSHWLGSADKGLRSANPRKPTKSLAANRKEVKKNTNYPFVGNVTQDPQDSSLVVTRVNKPESVQFSASDVKRVEMDDQGNKNLILRNGERVRYTRKVEKNSPESLKRRVGYER